MRNYLGISAVHFLRTFLASGFEFRDRLSSRLDDRVGLGLLTVAVALGFIYPDREVLVHAVKDEAVLVLVAQHHQRLKGFRLKGNAMLCQVDQQFVNGVQRLLRL